MIRRKGFSFVEVMFAVIILGLGFIMVAAIFPVAIQQAKSTTEETTAAAIARGAVAYAQRALSDGPSGATIDRRVASNCVPLPPTGTPPVNPIVRSLMPADAPDPTNPAGLSLWKSVRSNIVLPDDARYGWVMLWSRAGDYNQPATWKPHVQVFVFPVLARATPTFTQDDTTIPSGGHVANLMARSVRVAVANDVVLHGGVDLLAFDLRGGGATAVNAVRASIESGYVVIANDKSDGRMNGRIFRLGSRRSDLDGDGAIFGDNTWGGDMLVYELQAGNDFARDPGANGAIYGPANPSDNDDVVAIGNKNPIDSTSSTQATGTADAFLIGRGYAPGLTPDSSGLLPYEGGAMPIGAYTTFVQIGG